MNRKILLLFILIAVTVTSTISLATKTTEDRTDTIETQCANEKIVNIVKLRSGILGGDAQIFYDCVSQDLYMNSSKATNVPIQFSFAINPDLELYFYPQTKKGQNSRDTKISIILSEKAKLIVEDRERHERTSYNTKNLSKSVQNFPFLTSIMNVPGWEVIDQ